jgi:hypothetical protein
MRGKPVCRQRVGGSGALERASGIEFNNRSPFLEGALLSRSLGTFKTLKTFKTLPPWVLLNILNAPDAIPLRPKPSDARCGC